MRGTRSMHDKGQKYIYNDLDENRGRKRPVGRSRNKLKDNVKMDLQEARDKNQHRALVNTLMNIRFV
jgi:hypothetical protein